MTKEEKRELVKGILFTSPWLVGFSIFVIYPILASFYYSFCNYSVLQPPRFIGLLNYKDLFTDPIFWKSLWNTGYFVIFMIPLGLVTSLSLAMLLNTKVRGMAFYRMIFFIPSLVPMVAGSILWMWIFNGEYGLFNNFLMRVGIPHPPNWLMDIRFAKPAIIIMSLWGLGNMIVIYLAGLQDVPVSLIEAADLDGANWFDKLWNITIPMISPVIYFNVIMAIIGSFQIFSQAYIMTGGGPQRSTTFYALYLYQTAFEDFRMGYASAMAWILFVIILILTLLITRVSKEKIYYGG
ncbi:MAG: spermidine/putrescine ABC transporter permease [Omnitrophica WOR_2 bacterium RIFCSPLOWO2_12_FULL_51_24]|nr:MAG: spermidine/putrescine ABC transporter permease [Omnitrophica WOR_2 bacterium RIFCSPLOWO2_02_FULL_50_19]OGX42772.1 MAG: spermidine/putrescine ABC transporter permease [Omnitrophica WOR_2 bacterium RIFCSPLOWO2_12_FULL_51_24]